MFYRNYLVAAGSWHFENPISIATNHFHRRCISQKVTGRIRLKLEVNPVHQSSDLQYADDELLAGLLTLATSQAYDEFESKVSAYMR